MTTLGSLVVDIRGRTAHLEGALKTAEQKVGLLEKGLGALGTAAKVGALAGGAAIVGMGAAVGKVGFDFLAMQQQSQIAFTTILGSSEKAKQFMAELGAFAAKTPFDLPGLTQAAARLTAVGVETSRVIPLMTALGDATAGMGTGAEGIQRAVTALTQMQQKGKVTGEEMLQLVEAGIPAWDALAAKLGVDVATAQEKVTKGQVKVNDLFAALEERSGPAMQRLAGMMDQQSRSWSGLLSTVKDTFAQFSGVVMGPVFERATQGLSRLSELMASPAFMQFGERVGEALGRATGAIVSFLSLLYDGLVAIGPRALAAGQALIGGLAAARDWIANTLLPAIGGLAGTAWDLVGPKASAAATAIIEGLGAAVTWLTDTLLPKIGELAGTAWDTVGPKAAEVGRAIVDGLDDVTAWVEEHWPALKADLVRAFEDARTEITPILDDIRQRVEGTFRDVETQDIEGAFERVTSAARGVDLSPLTGAFAPLVAEGGKWRDFVNQDFSTAMANLARGLDAGREQLQGMIPSWSDFGNAGRLAGATVVASASEIASTLTGLSAGVRATLQIVIDLLNNDWAGAFRSAVGAALNLAQAVPGLSSAITGLRAVVTLVAAALDKAAGFARSLGSGIREAASAASNALNPLGGVLDLLGKIGGAKGALDFVLPGSLPPLAQGFKDVGEQAVVAAAPLGGLADTMYLVGDASSETGSRWARSMAVLAENAGALRAAQSALRDLEAQMRAAKLALAMDRENAGLKEYVEGLAFTIQVQKDLVVSLKDAAAAWEAERTALEGFTDALAAMQQGGVGALKLGQQLVKAIVDDTGQAGESLVQSLTTMIDKAVAAAGPGAALSIAQLGQQVIEAFRAALSDPANPAMLDAAIGMLGQLDAAVQAEQEHVRALGTLTAETFQAGLAASFASEGLRNQIGAAGVSLMDALNVALEQGGIKNIEKLTDLAARMLESVETLPEQFQGLAPELQAALEAMIAEPSAAAHARLVEVVSDINNAFSLIPKDLARLSPQMHRVVLDLIEQVDAGTIPLATAIDRWKLLQAEIPKDLSDLLPAYQAAVQALVDLFAAGTLSAAAFAEQLKEILAQNAAAVRAQAEATRAAQQAAQQAAASAPRSAGGVVGSGGGSSSVDASEVALAGQPGVSSLAGPGKYLGWGIYVALNPEHLEASRRQRAKAGGASGMGTRAGMWEGGAGDLIARRDPRMDELLALLKRLLGEGMRLEVDEPGVGYRLAPHVDAALGGGMSLNGVRP